MNSHLSVKNTMSVLVALWLMSCQPPAPEPPPINSKEDLKRSQQRQEERRRQCAAFAERDQGPLPPTPPLVSCQPGDDAACGEGSACVTWEGTSACAVTVDRPSRFERVDTLVLVTQAHVGAGSNQCPRGASISPVTVPINKRDALRLSRADGDRLALMLCRYSQDAQPECDLPLGKSYRLLGYYRSGTTEPGWGVTFEVIHAEPLARGPGP